MREYCLVANYNAIYRTGTVVNMCMTGKPTAPELTDYQKEKGLLWIPIAKVSQVSLAKYQYWNERP